jgi:hypothetical protein
LWAAAVGVARKEGVSRTLTELRVEWNHLKPEAAHGGGLRCNAEASAAGIRGTALGSARYGPNWSFATDR